MDEVPDECDMILVGREDRCDLVIEPWMIREDCPYKVDQISRIHFAIFRQGGKPMLQCNSANGTYVNEKKLGKGEVTELKTEARISVLGSDLELFWFIDEKAMKENQRYPREISKYFAIGNIVGSGTFAKVRKGFLKKEGTPVAIKFIDKNKLRWAYQYNEQDLISIKSEVQILSNLNHECVTKLWSPGFFDTQDYLIILMEFADGGELDKQVGYDKTMGRINESTALIQFYQISHAVAYIHSKNICHRDLKLTNILMTQPEDPECQLKISDFGISKVWTKENQLKTKCGSPLFMAPEVNNAVDGHPYTDKADCWALGIVLHQLLSGNLPHKTQGKMDTWEWEQISDEAKDLVRRLLEPEPEDRLASAQILHHPWFNSQRHYHTVRKAREVMFGVEDSDYKSSEHVSSNQEDGENIKNNTPTQQVVAENCLEINTKANDKSKDKVMAAAVKALSEIQVNSIPASESSSLAKDSLLQDSPDVSVVFKKANQDQGTPISEKMESRKVAEAEVDKRLGVFDFVDSKEKNAELNFDTLKSRLRPRNNPIDYLKVNIVKQSNDPQHLHSPNRKRKEVAFLLNDGGKRRRRYSEHAMRMSDQVPREEKTTFHSNKRGRERRKTAQGYT